MYSPIHGFKSQFLLLTMFVALWIALAGCATAEVPPTPVPLPTGTSTPSPTPTREPTPTPDIQKYLDLELPEGDVNRGRNAAISRGCFYCHFDEGSEYFAISFAASDGLPPILERGEFRIADPNYTGKATSNLEYIYESIYLPEIYLVEGEWVESMPLGYNYLMTDPQELAHLLAWMQAVGDPDDNND